jgi:hypothetical protein
MSTYVESPAKSQRTAAGSLKLQIRDDLRFAYADVYTPAGGTTSTASPTPWRGIGNLSIPISTPSR